MSDFTKYATPIIYPSAHGRSARLKKQYAPLDWSLVDVAAQIEFHTSTRLRREGNTQLVGACPFPDCAGDDDGFIVWPHKSKYGQHFHCRTCRRTGDLITLLQGIHGWGFLETLVSIGLRDTLDDVSLTHVRQEQSRWAKQERERQMWFNEQLDLLTLYYPDMQKALHTLDRPRNYLASRGVRLEDAQQFGLGYFPLPEESGHKIEDAHLTGWFGRIVFPLSGQWKGMTFAGRTLRLWEPGMTPAEHKGVLKAHNEANPEAGIGRVRKTSPCGYFGYAEAVKHPHIVVCEGEFDALSLVLAGLSAVVAMGTSFPTRLIPLRVETVTLALDADVPGREAAKRLALDLAARGIEVRTINPTTGEDWNDTLIAGDTASLQEAFTAQISELVVETEPAPLTNARDEASATHCCICGAEPWTLTEEQIAYCKACWRAQGHIPTSEEACCVCGDFCDRVDETGAWCSQCWAAQEQKHVVHLSNVASEEKEDTGPPVEMGGVSRTLAGITDLAAHLVPGENYVVDLETTGKDPRNDKIISIAIGRPGDVSILDMRPYYALDGDEQQAWCEALHTLFSIKGITWIGHNLKFDTKHLLVHFGAGAALPCVYDTMLVEMLLHNGEKTGSGYYRLDTVAERYGLQASKAAREWFIDLDTRLVEWYAPFPQEQITYMQQDIEIPWSIREKQQEAITSAGLARVVELEHQTLPAVAAMEVHGVLVDRDRWQRILNTKRARQRCVEEQIQQTLRTALASVQECAQPGLFGEAPVLPALNLSSSEKVRAALSVLGVEIDSIKQEALEAVHDAHPIIQTMLEWRQVQKFTSAFGERLLARVADDGRIHAAFEQLGAVSGRIISHTPNLQQIPQRRMTPEDDIRSCFIAPAGHKLLTADLSNIEMRILADCSQDAVMLGMFASGKDLHAETARMMFGLAEDVDTKKHLLNGVKARDIAKAINFGLAYGMGPQGLANRIGTSVEEAQDLMKKYFATYKSVKAYLTRSGRQGVDSGYSTSLSGRRRIFPDVASSDYRERGEVERASKNHPIQGACADILKRALTLLYKRLPSMAHVVMSIHDEVVVECPDALVHDAEECIKACLVEACKDFLTWVHIPEPDVLESDHWIKE